MLPSLAIQKYITQSLKEKLSQANIHRTVARSKKKKRNSSTFKEEEEKQKYSTKANKEKKHHNTVTTTREENRVIPVTVAGSLPLSSPPGLRRS